MSNIYIQEPPTSGKVLLVTSVGDIDIELWSKEAPKACRNFVQLCLEGYYDGTIFHRMVPDFIVQGGDPTGTGHGGESVYGKPFQDEFHSRLRFVRRGLVAMANAGAHDNQSQFFFTLGATPELNNKHTIFGKVGGNTIYNMIKLGEGETDRNEKPLFPQKIIKTKVIQNPFEDIVPRVVKSSRGSDSSAKSKKSDAPAKKDFKLLSFGEEAEEEERETTEIAQTLRSKGKSSHDLLNDTSLSAVPAVDSGDSDDESSSKLRNDSNRNESNYEGKNVDVTGEAIDNVRKKLKGGSGGQDKQTSKRRADVDEEYTSEARDGFELKSSSKLDELKAEAKRLKMELGSQKKKKNEQRETESNKNVEQTEKKPTTHAPTAGNDEIDAFRASRQKYKEQSAVKLKKGSDREAETLKMLAAFQSKIASAKKLSEFVSGANDESDDKGSEKEKEEDSGDDDADDFSWVRHQLHFESSDRKVLDANVNDVDRYEVYDPRNPLTQRRREASAKAMKQKR